MKTLEIQPDGRVTGIDKRMFGEMPFALVTNQPNNAIVIAANASAPYVSFSTNGDGPVNVSKLAISETGSCLVKLTAFDGRDNIDLCSGAIHSDTIFGTGAKPYPLPEPLYIDELSRIDAEIQDISNAQNTVRLAMKGMQSKYPVADPTGKIRKGKEQRNRLAYPFFYTFNAGNLVLGALGVSSQAIEIRSNHNFQLFQISGVSTGTYTLDIQDGNTGESIFNAPGDQHFQIANGLVVGSASFPFRLRVPRIFKHGQKIIVNITDTSNAGNTIFLTFGGRACAVELPGAAQ